MSPMCKSEDEAWSEDDNVSSSVSRETNVCNGAWPCDKVFSLPAGLGACEGGVKLSHCPQYVVPRNA